MPWGWSALGTLQCLGWPAAYRAASGVPPASSWDPSPCMAASSCERSSVHHLVMPLRQSSSLCAATHHCYGDSYLSLLPCFRHWPALHSTKQSWGSAVHAHKRILH